MRGTTALVLLVLMLLGPAMAAPRPGQGLQIADLVRQARAERQSGDFEAAIYTLSRARAVSPENADVLLLLGQTQGFLERYDEALTTLDQARALAPDYLDVGLAIARVHFYRGAPQAAEAELAGLRARAPNDPRIRLLAGRVALSQGELIVAKASFDRAQQLDPEAAEPVAGLADVAMADGDPFTAVDLYERALERNPDDASLFDRLLGARDQARRWRVETEIAFSRFDDGRPSWRESATRFTYRLDSRTALTGALESAERFRRRDIHLELGAAHRASARGSGYVAIGVTPASDFRERFALRGGGALRLREGDPALGPTLLTLDGRYANYANGGTVTLTPGLDQYLFDGALTMTGRWINVIEEGGRHLHGPLARLALRPAQDAVLHVGVAAAPESQGRLVVDTHAFFGGLALALDDDLVARTNLLRETREAGSARTAVTLGFGVEF